MGPFDDFVTAQFLVPWLACSAGGVCEQEALQSLKADVWAVTALMDEARREYLRAFSRGRCSARISRWPQGAA